MRSGGATEAVDIPDVTDRMFDDADGWPHPKMKHTYRRQKQRNAQKGLNSGRRPAKAPNACQQRANKEQTTIATNFRNEQERLF